MAVMLAAHHMLTDGLELAELAMELADLYVEGTKPVYADENLIGKPDDLPQGSKLAGISRLLVQCVNRQWTKENHSVDYQQYIKFEKMYAGDHPVQNQTYEIDAEELSEINQQCVNRGITVNDWLMTQMFLRTGTQKIIMAVDIRSKLPLYHHGALGNYTTAVSVICKSRTQDMWKKAGEVHKIISKIKENNRQMMTVLSCYFEMDPGLLDAAAISALGGFQSKAASFVGKSMFGFGGDGSFSISNLGKYENKNVQSMLFIPPASPAAKLTLGVVTLNGVLKACTSEVNNIL